MASDVAGSLVIVESPVEEAACDGSGSVATSSNKAKPLSSAASPLVMGVVMSAKRLMGDTNINMAVMKATNPPTVAPARPVRLWIKAMTSTEERATAAMSCVRGDMAAEAMVDFKAKLLSLLLSA